jgi:hypothetical protein
MLDVFHRRKNVVIKAQPNSSCAFRGCYRRSAGSFTSSLFFGASLKLTAQPFFFSLSLPLSSSLISLENFSQGACVHIIC